MSRVAIYRRLTFAVSAVILSALGLVFAAVLGCAFYALNTWLVNAAGTLAQAHRQPATAVQVPGWWQRHVNTLDGYSLALPPDWQIIPLEGDALTQYLDNADPSEAAVARQLALWAQERRAAGWGVWVAAAPDGTLGRATTINMVRQPLDGKLSVEEFANENLAALQDSPGKASNVGREHVNLAAGPALRAEMAFSVPGADKSEMPLHMVQYYLVRGSSGYVLTAIARPESAPTYSATFAAILRSLQWTS